MSETILVRDDGFHADDFHEEIVDLEHWQNQGGVRIAGEQDWTDLPSLASAQLVDIYFSRFSDGRGFTLARRLRQSGYTGRLRASGHVLADQYAMARRVGFDEIGLSRELAARQPQGDWLARADWQQNDYQARLRG